MPEFIASRIKAPSAGVGPKGEAALAEAVAAFSRSFAARRDLGLACAFLAEAFDPPRFWLYGAGTHTASLLEHFGDAWKPRLLGIIDRNLAGRVEFRGFPLQDIAQARYASEPILVAHPFYESEIAAGLSEVGVDTTRIRYLYQDVDFVALSRRTLEAISVQGPSVILGSSRYITVTDSDLARVLDPATTPYLAFDLFERTEARPPFKMFPMDKSIDAVVASLQALRPRLVYLRTKMETDFLAYLVRQVLPECVLIHELWDFSVVFEDETLIRWLKFPAAYIEASRLAECWSVRESDLVISKWGGPEWANLFRDKISTELFFGGIGQGPAPVRAVCSVTTPRVLYAGLLPKPEDLAAMPYDYNFLERLERLAQAGAAQVTILNSGHDGPAADSVYQEYAIRFARSGIHYGRRVRYDELMVLAAEQDVGWLALDGRENWDMAKPLIVPMRFTGYVQAGLPIVINQPWALCVDLVKRFSAGIVLEDDSDAEAKRALSEADTVRLREGVLALHEHMRASNGRVLDRMAKLGRAESGV